MYPVCQVFLKLKHLSEVGGAAVVGKVVVGKAVVCVVAKVVVVVAAGPSSVAHKSNVLSRFPASAMVAETSSGGPVPSTKFNPKPRFISVPLL